MTFHRGYLQSGPASAYPAISPEKKKVTSIQRASGDYAIILKEKADGNAAG